jgi:5-methylcytosine-specific restriction endonuclease McrA
MSMKEHTSISKQVYRRVKERDGGCCVVCGKPWTIQCAHYISRAQGGLGIPQNLVMLCVDCHRAYDGTEREAYGEMIRDYLKGWYKDWNEKDLVYDKWDWTK